MRAIKWLESTEETKAMVLIPYIVAFFSGALVLVIVEALLLWYFFARLRRKNAAAARPLVVDADAYSPSKIFIEGDMWVVSTSPVQLEAAIKNLQSSKLVKERKSKREPEEFSIVLKHAKLENRTLFLVDADGTSSSISLDGASIMAVSSTTSAARKWAKKYPLKLEHKDRKFSDSICLLYFKTAWEKESWCEALRAAARGESGSKDWYSSVKIEFRAYLSQLKENFPEFFKPGSSTWKEQRAVTKRSVSWKRILKKKSKADGSKTSKAVTVQVEDAKVDDSAKNNSDGESDANNHSSDANQESSSGGKKENSVEPHVGPTVSPDPLVSNRLDGTVAGLNLLVSRLFFDLYHSPRFINNIQRRVQNLLSRIPTPGYISPIICSRIDIGKSPPLVHGLRALPIANDVWGVEADLGYLGGSVVTIETRLDMRESRPTDNKFEASPAGAATADIISKSIQTVEDDLETAVESSIEPGEQNSASSKEASGSSRKRWVQWKAFLSSLADQVSQVPLVLSMRVVAIKGTMQFRIKSAPSDRIWYSFTSMPELELIPEPSVGEHKITTGPLLAYIVERLQILVSETMVLPNCEDIYVPWMLSEEEDWLQESSVPFPQALADVKIPAEKSKAGSRKGSSDSLPELKTPLLDKADESDPETEASKLLPSTSDAEPRVEDAIAGAATVAAVDPSSFVSADGQKKRRGISRRERMLSIGKKFEEKTRNFAERMRERFEKEN